MKVLLKGILLSLCIASLGRAGTPDVDSVTNLLRQKFNQAKIPEVTTLAENFWNCEGHLATKDSSLNSEIASAYYTKSEGLLRGNYFWEPLRGNETSVDYVVIPNKELRGELSVQGKPLVTFVRMTNSGKLIVELAGGNFLGVKALGDSSLTAFGYLFCSGEKLFPTPPDPGPIRPRPPLSNPNNCNIWMDPSLCYANGCTWYEEEKFCS